MVDKFGRGLPFNLKHEEIVRVIGRDETERFSKEDAEGFTHCCIVPEMEYFGRNVTIAYKSERKSRDGFTRYFIEEDGKRFWYDERLLKANTFDVNESDIENLI